MIQKQHLWHTSGFQLSFPLKKLRQNNFIRKIMLSLILENRFVKNEGDNHAFYLHFCDSLDEIAITSAADSVSKK